MLHFFFLNRNRVLSPGFQLADIDIAWRASSPFFLFLMFWRTAWRVVRETR
jgi:hypothetical protein